MGWGWWESLGGVGVVGVHRDVRVVGVHRDVRGGMGWWESLGVG